MHLSSFLPAVALASAFLAPSLVQAQVRQPSHASTQQVNAREVGPAPAHRRVSNESRTRSSRSREQTSNSGDIDRMTSLPGREPMRQEVAPLYAAPLAAGVVAAPLVSGQPLVLTPATPLVAQPAPVAVAPAPVVVAAPPALVVAPPPVVAPVVVAPAPAVVVAPSSVISSESATPAPSTRRNSAAAASLAASAQSERSTRAWVARGGQTLRRTLEDWAKEAGWKVAWRSDHEYTLMASAEFDGIFEDATGTLLEAFANASPPLAGRLYTGNKVLVISSPQDADLN